MAAMLKPPPALEVPALEAPVLPPLPDPMDAGVDMSRAAREARAALRRAHPEAWRAQLAGLWHFDPDYSYEPFHEYGGEATTDPDYPNHSLHRTEFDANGDNLPVDLRAYALQGQGRDTLTASAAAGLAVDFERSVRLAPDAIARAGRTFGAAFHPRKLVTPDLLVTPQLTEAEEAVFVSADHDVWRMDRGAPAPRLALEVLSAGHVDNDLEVKVHLYAAMGVPEYFVCDLGDKRWKGSPRELLLFRLGEDGAYVRQPVAEVYHSHELGVLLRMWDDPQELQDAADGVKLRYRAAPRLQYRDAAGYWHDAVADRERAIRDEGREEGRQEGRQEGREEGRQEGREEGRQEGREEGAAAMALQCLDIFLAPVLEAHALAAVRAAWAEHGPPPRALERVREVGRDPGRWRDLLAYPATETDNRPAGREADRGKPPTDGDGNTNHGPP